MGEDLLPLLSEDVADIEERKQPEFTIRRENGCDDVFVTISIPEVVVDGDYGRMQRAVELFSSSVPSFGKPTTVDPFLNKTPKVSGLYEKVKTVLLLPVLVLRLLVVALILVVGFFATKTALAGWNNSQGVLSRWRRNLMGVTRFCGRFILFCFGFHWVRRIGKPALKETAPIMVSNHVSFVDSIFYFYELFPSIVSSKSHDSMFLAGAIIRSMQIIPVDKADAESRKHATLEIKRRAASMDFPSVLLFPEGTTTNGRTLISFKLGAFAPGFPIQPVVIRYPFVHFDVSWGDISLVNLMVRMLTQFHNFMEVEYLPVVYPSEREVQNPAEFAERVRHIMAQALCVPVTEHTYGDLMLSVNAQRLRLRSPASYMVEMGKIEKVLGLRSGEVMSFLEKFAAMNPTRSGTVSMNQFLEWHHLPRCWMSKKIFDLYDQSGRGFITFREFVAASGSISKHEDFKTRMNAAFTSCNLRSDGCISALELEKTLKLSMPSISTAKVKMWFKKLDDHGDGVISWEEFQAFLEKNPELLPIFMVGTL